MLEKHMNLQFIGFIYYVI